MKFKRWFAALLAVGVIALSSQMPVRHAALESHPAMVADDPKKPTGGG
jgi:hypothetical protein